MNARQKTRAGRLMVKTGHLLNEIRAELANGEYFGNGLAPAITSIASAQVEVERALQAMAGNPVTLKLSGVMVDGGDHCGVEEGK